MPKIKRWYPVSHSFNRDPEIQQLRQTYGDWMGYVWQEMCSIGDLNEGEIKGEVASIAASMSYISLTKRPSLSAKRITSAITFMEQCGWIKIQTDHILILNYWKYHRTREQSNSHMGTGIAPSEPSEPNNPSILPNLPSNPLATGVWKGQVPSFDLFWKYYPRKVAKAKAEKSWGKINSAEYEFLFSSLAVQRTSEQWQDSDGRFIPHPTTWLNQERWKSKMDLPDFDEIPWNSSGPNGPECMRCHSHHGPDKECP